MIKKNVLLLFLLLSLSILLVSTPLFAEESTGFKPAKYKQSVYFFTHSLTDYSSISFACGSKIWWGLDLRVNMDLYIHNNENKDSHLPIGDDTWDLYKDERKNWDYHYDFSFLFIRSFMQKDRFEVYGGFGPLFGSSSYTNETLSMMNGETQVERREDEQNRWGAELMGGVRWWLSPRVAVVTECYMQDYYQISETIVKEKDGTTGNNYFTTYQGKDKSNYFEFKLFRIGMSLYL